MQDNNNYQEVAKSNYITAGYPIHQVYGIYPDISRIEKKTMELFYNNNINNNNNNNNNFLKFIFI